METGITQRSKTQTGITQRGITQAGITETAITQAGITQRGKSSRLRGKTQRLANFLLPLCEVGQFDHR